MDDLKDLAWRSCHLGIRIALQALDLPQTGEPMDKCHHILSEIASGKITPQESDRDLAALIVAGLDQEATGASPSSPLSLHTDRLPLRMDEGGVVRIGKSRIALDLIVEEYENGMTPDDLVRAYNTLELADVYAVIAYYLRHRTEVKAYLNLRDEEAVRLRSLIESRRPSRPTKADLLERREQDHAEAGK